LSCDDYFGKSFSLFSQNSSHGLPGFRQMQIVATGVPSLGFRCDLCGDFASFAGKSLKRKGLVKVREENRTDQARILVL
jgi:hypothetical protein